MQPKLKMPYDDHMPASNETGLDCSCDGHGRAKQSFAEEVDINTIVKRFNLTGQLPSNVRMPEYGDYTQVVDFQTAMNAIASAGEAFDAMPAHIRTRFHNNPAEFVDFCLDDANAAEAAKLGLVKKPLPTPPDPVVEAKKPAPEGPGTVTPS